MAAVDDVVGELAGILGAGGVLTGDAISDDYCHDESLHTAPVRPAAVVRPQSSAEVAEVLRLANAAAIPVTARGSGTGLSGAATPRPDAILVSFERMNRVLEVDTANHVAVVQPGVTLAELDAAVAEHGLVYPVQPGENSASLGGNVATNAGGMRAVKYGVTRHRVLGLEAVLPSGDVIRTGGKFVKASVGYDLTQLLIGAEGSLALVTEATLRLGPRISHRATVLAPFGTLDAVAAAVPAVVGTGIDPMILEYVDMLTMAAMTYAAGLELGIPDEVRSQALAYLVVQVEGRKPERVEEDSTELAELLFSLGALDVYVLPGGAAAALIDAREKAFWTAKGAGADDIVDVVVPRAAMPAYLAGVARIAAEHASLVTGCGHVGDGNVHLSVFQKDAATRATVMQALFAEGMAHGGAISGEHGLGRDKVPYFRALEDPVKLDLLARIKAVFDPVGILNPDAIAGGLAAGPTAGD